MPTDIDPDTEGAENFVVKFTFTTDAVVSDTLDFEWHRQARYAGLNGFAIVAVPEPGTLGLIGAAGLGVMVVRRLRAK